MSKRDQINIVLDPETREALDGLMATVRPMPTLTSLISYLLRDEWDVVRKRMGKAKPPA